MTRSVLAVIPARGGSKGIPEKNLQPLWGRPLIAWTIIAARKAKCVSRVVVSSDSDRILDTAIAWGADAVRRPHAISGDLAPSELAVEHAWHTVGGAKSNHDAIAILQPTSPLRGAAHIDSAYEALSTIVGDSEAPEMVVSVMPPTINPCKAFVRLGPWLQGLMSPAAPYLPRQSLPEAFQSNGAIYLIDVGAFFRSGSLANIRRIRPYFMSEHASVDIDRMADLEHVRGLECLPHDDPGPVAPGRLIG